MSKVIGYKKPQNTCTCQTCGAIVQYHLGEVLEKPDDIFNSALMNRHVECPNCHNYVYVGSRRKYSWDKGNFDERYNGYGDYVC